MSRILVAVLLMSASICASAADVVYGGVNNLHINEQGLILFKLAPDPGSLAYPASDCGIAEADMWHFKIESSNGFYKEFYSTLLTAMAANRSIYVGHNAACGAGTPAVIATYLYFKDQAQL